MAQQRIERMNKTGCNFPSINNVIFLEVKHESYT